MDELMKLFANKSVSSDPNDMPLSTLIENSNASMDVSFVGRNNFGNNTYRGIILGRFLVIPLIIMVIPTTTLMEILIRCPLILRIVLKNL